MINGKTVTYARGDDWEGLYIDGKLVLEDHSIDVRDILEAVGFKIKTVWVDLDWLAETGSLPGNEDNLLLDNVGDCE